MLVWRRGPHGLALVVNEADFSVDELIAIAESATLPWEAVGARPSMVSAEVPVRTSEPPEGEFRICPLALMSGYPVPDPRSRLGVVDTLSEVHAVVWPFGYTAWREADGVALVNAEGQTIARGGRSPAAHRGLTVEDVFRVCPWGGVEVANQD